MPRRWTPQEEGAKRAELHELYVQQNLTIREAGAVLGISEVSVYKLASSNLQISFTNHSEPLLNAVRIMLQKLKFCPSKISTGRIYLTRQRDCARFFEQIGFKNLKHRDRFISFVHEKYGWIA